jgi:hypothetical protein
MSKSVVLDTNALPIRRGLNGTLWLSARKICELHDIEIVVPSIVVAETVNLRREGYAEAEGDFLTSLSKISKFYDLQPIYVPSTQEICDEWKNEIEQSLSIVIVNGDDAVEALEREASRVRPARNGSGARDSAIWLTVLRRALTDEVVYFISNNTKDFGNDGGIDLHQSLKGEIGSTSGSVCYLHSINDLIQLLADPVTVPPLDLVATAEILQTDIEDQLSVLPEVTNHFENEGPDVAATTHVNITEASGTIAYGVGDRTLVLVSGKGSSNVETVSDSIDMNFTFRAWIELDPASNEVIAGEVFQIAVIEPESV